MGRSIASQAAALQILLAGAASVALPAAQNLLPNPDFDQSGAPIAGWQVIFPATSTFDWDAEDADDCVGRSGSGRGVNSATGVNGDASFQACVPVTPGTVYSFGGRVLFSEAQATTGYVGVLVTFYSLGGCAGTALDDFNSLPVVYTDSAGFWTATRLDEAEAPVGAQSAAFRVVLVKNQDSGGLEVFLDRMYFQDTPGFRFADDFELESLCRWPDEFP